MPLMQMKMRARKLLDPLNSHEFVEVEVVYEPDLIVTGTGAGELMRRRLEAADVAMDKCRDMLYDALHEAEQGAKRK